MGIMEQRNCHNKDQSEQHMLFPYVNGDLAHVVKDMDSLLAPEVQKSHYQHNDQRQEACELGSKLPLQGSFQLCWS